MIQTSLDSFKDNYKHIIASFVLAFILWFAITTNKEYTTKIEIPFSIERVAEGKVLNGIPPDHVVLEVRGKGRSLISLNFVDKNFVLELPEIESSTTLHLSDYTSYINIPSELGIEIVDIVEPKTLELTVDDYLRDKKPIRIQSTIKPAPGYILADTKSSQDSVWVSGPAGIVNSYKYIKTDSLKFSEIKYPFQMQVNLISPKPDVVELDPKKIIVSFTVEQLVERNIYNIPIQIIRVPGHLEAAAEPATIMLRVKGGESKISDLKPGDISVIFDYSKDYRPSVSDYPMQIEMPLGVSWLEASPQKFHLKLVKKVSL
jgi:hypothetical protein